MLVGVGFSDWHIVKTGESFDVLRTRTILAVVMIMLVACYCCTVNNGGVYTAAGL